MVERRAHPQLAPARWPVAARAIFGIEAGSVCCRAPYGPGRKGPRGNLLPAPEEGDQIGHFAIAQLPADFPPKGRHPHPPLCDRRQDKRIGCRRQEILVVHGGRVTRPPALALCAVALGTVAAVEPFTSRRGSLDHGARSAVRTWAAACRDHEQQDPRQDPTPARWRGRLALPEHHFRGYGVSVLGPNLPYFASMAARISRTVLFCRCISITSRVMFTQMSHPAPWLLNVIRPSG